MCGRARGTDHMDGVRREPLVEAPAPVPGGRTGGRPALVLRMLLVDQFSTPMGPRSTYELEDGVFM